MGKRREEEGRVGGEVKGEEGGNMESEAEGGGKRGGRREMRRRGFGVKEMIQLCLCLKTHNRKWQNYYNT